MVYLLRSANALFPGARLGPGGCRRAAWAGLRPLLAADPGRRGLRVSREHRIVRGHRGMLTIAGGKLTTWRSMAAEMVDQVGERCSGHEHAGEARASSRPQPLPGR